MFKALPLPAWHDLPDVKLAKAFDERASVHRFCGFSRSEGTLERTAFMRYRGRLVARSLDRALFETVTTQRKTRAITVKTRTMVAATVIASASEGQDDDQRGEAQGKPAVHGFKAHVGVDATSDLVETLSATSANLNDGRVGPDALLDDPGEVFAHRFQHGLGTVGIRSGETSRP